MSAKNNDTQDLNNIKRAVQTAPEHAKNIAATVVQAVPEKVEDVAAAVMQAAPERAKDVAATVVQAVPEATKREVITEAIQDLSSAAKKDVATETMQSLSGKVKRDVATKAVQGLSGEAKRIVITEAVQGLSGKAKKDIATEAIQDLSDEAKKDIATEALRVLPPVAEKDLAVIQLAATADDDVQKAAGAQLTILNAYYNLALGQASRSFRLAIIAAAAGLVFLLAAVAVLLAEPYLLPGQQSHNIAIVSVISGAIVEVVSGVNFYLYNRTTNQLAGFHNRLDQTQRFLLANSICGSLDEIKEETLAALVRAIAPPPQSAEAHSS